SDLPPCIGGNRRPARLAAPDKERNPVLYHAYEMHRSMLTTASAWAAVGAEVLQNPRLPMGYFGMGPMMASALEVFSQYYAPRGKPEWGIESVEIGGTAFEVSSSVEVHKPFCVLRRFRREGLAPDAPRVLLVAPMSGHYATLLRGSAARLVENQEVWITDWADAKLVPASVGDFDLDDYIDYLIEFREHIGHGAHI